MNKRSASNPPTGEDAQLETITPQQETDLSQVFEILPVWKREHLCIGLISMIHNCFVCAVLWYYAFYWLSSLSYLIKLEKKNATNDHYYSGQMKITKGVAVCFFVLNIIGCVLASVALRIDNLLRYSTNPTMDQLNVAKILQNYVIVNLVCWLYSFIMLLVMISAVHLDYKYTFMGMMIGSMCLRLVCWEIIERYLILLVKSAGIKTCCACCGGFFRPSKQAKVQPAPSDQVQQV